MNSILTHRSISWHPKWWAGNALPNMWAQSFANASDDSCNCIFCGPWTTPITVQTASYTASNIHYTAAASDEWLNNVTITYPGTGSIQTSLETIQNGLDSLLTRVARFGVQSGEPGEYQRAIDRAVQACQSVLEAMEGLEMGQRQMETPGPFANGAARVVINQDEAEKRAEALLRSQLSPEQLATYEAAKYFDVIIDEHRTYRIRRGWAGNIELIDARRVTVAKYCIHPKHPIPVGDAMLAQKLMLETEEDRFLDVANMTPLLPTFTRGFDHDRRQLVRERRRPPRASQLDLFVPGVAS